MVAEWLQNEKCRKRQLRHGNKVASCRSKTLVKKTLVKKTLVKKTLVKKTLIKKTLVKKTLVKHESLHFPQQPNTTTQHNSTHSFNNPLLHPQQLNNTHTTQQT